MNAKLGRTLLGLAGLAAAVSLVACADADGDGTASPTADATGSATPAGSQDGAAAISSAPAAPSTLYVANTGGTGVAVRPRCDDAARSPDGLREGTQVAVVSAGTDACAGWMLVDAAGRQSWVRVEYLSDQQPAVVAAPPGSSSPDGYAPPPTYVAPPPPPPPSGGGFGRVEKVLLYQGYQLPTSQLEYRSPSVPRNPYQYVPQPGDYTCNYYHWHASQPVQALDGSVLRDPEPNGCGFGRADQLEVREVLVP